MIDIRLPIGGLFTTLGLMLFFYGIGTYGNVMYDIKSLGYNINMIWGMVMMIFGGSMLYFGLTAGRRKVEAQAHAAQPEPKSPNIR